MLYTNNFISFTQYWLFSQAAAAEAVCPGQLSCVGLPSHPVNSSRKNQRQTQHRSSELHAFITKKHDNMCRAESLPNTSPQVTESSSSQLHSINQSLHNSSVTLFNSTTLMNSSSATSILNLPVSAISSLNESSGLSTASRQHSHNSLCHLLIPFNDESKLKSVTAPQSLRRSGREETLTADEFNQRGNCCLRYLDRTYRLEGNQQYPCHCNINTDLISRSPNIKNKCVSLNYIFNDVKTQKPSHVKLRRSFSLDSYYFRETSNISKCNVKYTNWIGKKLGVSEENSEGIFCKTNLEDGLCQRINSDDRLYSQFNPKEFSDNLSIDFETEVFNSVSNARSQSLLDLTIDSFHVVVSIPSSPDFSSSESLYSYSNEILPYTCLDSMSNDDDDKLILETEHFDHREYYLCQAEEENVAPQPTILGRISSLNAPVSSEVMQEKTLRHIFYLENSLCEDIVSHKSDPILTLNLPNVKLSDVHDSLPRSASATKLRLRRNNSTNSMLCAKASEMCLEKNILRMETFTDITRENQHENDLVNDRSTDVYKCIDR